VRAIAPDCDLVLVVGSKNSSNSRRLTEIAEACGTPARLIDDKSELDPGWLENVDTLLITAGASAPEDLAQDLVLHLIQRYGGEVEQHDITHEAVEFGLPGTLRQFMRDRGIDPAGRRITMNNVGALKQWLDEHGIEHRTVDLTVRATG
jgi:4-hydroxy-3-methylbut-2-enyl diphosphate reductase